MDNTRTSARWMLLLAFAAVYLIWGTTYLVILIGLDGFPPFLLASVRFTMAASLLLGWCWFKGERRITWQAVGKNFLVGVVVLAGGQGLLNWSEQHIASGYAAVLGATLPVWFVIIDRRQWQTCFSNKYIIVGLILGFLGILLLFREQLDMPVAAGSEGMGMIASLVVLFGCICWVGGSLYYRYQPAPGSIIFNLGWQLLCGAVFCLFVSFFTGEWTGFSFHSVEVKSWLAVSYLAVAGSVVAFVAYNWLLTQKPSAVVGTYAYINPVIAVLLGWIIAHEIISSYQIGGMLLILLSAMMINFSKSKVLNRKQKVEV